MKHTAYLRAAHPVGIRATGPSSCLPRRDIWARSADTTSPTIGLSLLRRRAYAGAAYRRLNRIGSG